MADFFSTLFGGGAQQDAANANAAALSQYAGQANTALGQGYSTGSQALNSAVGAYTPLANLGATYSSGAPTLMNALGVNGPQGNAAATAAYQSSPGYSFQMDQGLQALQRQAAASGMPQTGNANIAAETYGQGLANQDYQQWLTNLQNTGQMGIGATGTAAAGQAAGYGSIANLATQYGEDQSGVSGNVASGTMADNNMVAAGQAAGAKNLLGAGLSLATLGLGGNPFGGSLTGGSGTSLASSAGSALKNLNLGQSLFGGGTPTGL